MSGWRQKVLVLLAVGLHRQVLGRSKSEGGRQQGEHSKQLWKRGTSAGCSGFVKGGPGCL